jgi:cephalosporin-C deacetylase-like acetyl esterase
VTWSVETDEGAELFTEATPRTLTANGKLALECPFSPSIPGFYRVTCTFRGSGSDEAEVSAGKVIGYSPERIRSPLTRGEDFDSFWQRTLERLADVAPEFELKWQELFDSPTHEVYEVTMRSLGGVRVGGWYEKPTRGSANAPYPALLCLPGYGSNMRPTGSSDPVAILSFNVRGHGNSQADVSGMPEDFWVRGLDDKEGYYYQSAYADCVRAVDVLASQPEIDRGRIAVTGGSQGGGLSLVTAALDPRISLCAPDIPFLCDWVRYFKTSDWPEMNEWVKAKPDRSWESTLHTLSYFDALNFADRIQCPVFMGLGLQDEVCPAATIFSVYNRLLGPKECRVYPEAGHWVEATHAQDRRQWILSHFQD